VGSRAQVHRFPRWPEAPGRGHRADSCRDAGRRYRRVGRGRSSVTTTPTARSAASQKARMRRRRSASITRRWASPAATCTRWAAGS